ncbi:MAG: MerR family transcriptional regulator [Acidobacteria bacterium]|nr:MerR family transcriptional regulator [Acidobacteriota bacterium]MBI3264950.1 MerR family transcriptional regulator [Acidobacteriota bacterium]
MTPRVQSHRLGFLTVGQTARILGISPSTLRLWENVGLVSPARSNGRYRLYSPELLAVLKRIKYLRDVKLLNFPGIKEVLGKMTKARSNGHAVTDLGAKLRRLRKRRGLGLVEAARQAKISAGFLSAVELSRANPSVATLQRLAATYGTTILDFYDLPRHPSRLVRPRDRRALQTASGVRIELLSTGARLLESQLFRVAPGAGSDGSYSHQGEEFIFMIKGTLEIWLDELECHMLREGDSFWFESTLGHRWYNPSKDEAVMIWVNSPPTF